MGVLGATTYSSMFWAKDVDEVVYKGKNFLPHIYDFFGYITTIIGGGITGVILYLITKTGISIATSASNFSKLNLASSVLIAYCGGLFHFRVQRMLSKITDKILKDKDQKPPETFELDKGEKSYEDNKNSDNDAY